MGSDGVVYVSNSWASSPANDGRVWAFSADLGTMLFEIPLDRQNAGGPALAGVGVMLCDRQGVYAYRTPPFQDPGLAAAQGMPELRGERSLGAATLATLELEKAAANAAAALVLGFSQIHAPLLGGTLVPAPDVVVEGLPTGPAGAIALAFDVPAGVPSALPLTFRYWIADPAGPAGAAASNAVSAVTP